MNDRVAYGSYGYHPCTRNLAALQAPELAALLAKGLNHIPVAKDDSCHALDQLAAAAEQYCIALADRGLLDALHVPAAQKAEAREHLISSAKAHALSWAHDACADMCVKVRNEDDELSPQLSSMLSSVQETIWLTEVDKAPNDLALICPAMAQHLIIPRLRKPRL